MTTRDLLFFVSAFGLAYIVGHSKISLPLRTLVGGTPSGAPPLFPGAAMLIEMLECPACFGFWIGLVYGSGREGTFRGAVLWGLATSGVNFALGRWTKLL